VLQAEFLGTLLFVFASSTVSSALGAGMAYTVASYATASALCLDHGSGIEACSCTVHSIMT